MVHFSRNVYKHLDEIGDAVSKTLAEKVIRLQQNNQVSGTDFVLSEADIREHTGVVINLNGTDVVIENNDAGYPEIGGHTSLEAHEKLDELITEALECGDIKVPQIAGIVEVNLDDVVPELKITCMRSDGPKLRRLIREACAEATSEQQQEEDIPAITRSFPPLPTKTDTDDTTSGDG